ncbi:MAG: ABC transporter permease [Edaphobacter sp.]|uniref:ABC transporter permease n=1 Tax=Edaphobacter sp. TaxID=1934404 RepID=UPI002383CFD7|nr:ABC transporter permease [Edaphobacter sp.]MDE1178447.1 ABC transporter permease [Edaphobacter sp.]
MSLRSRIRSWWQALAHRSQIDREVQQELEFHLNAHADHLIENGVEPSEAMRQAKIAFGRADVQKEKYRAAIGLRPLYEIGSDIRYGFRSLYRHPMISFAAVISLALGIGATTAIFNLIDSALLHPFPYVDAERIVNPSLIDLKQPLVPTWFALEPAQYESFLKAKSVDSVLGFMLGAQPETGGAFPEDVGTAYVTPNMNDFLGVNALLGRGLRPSDGSGNVIVLGYKYWQRRFGGDPSVIGHTLQLSHTDLTIIGVMPARFAFTETVGNVDAYVPWSASRAPALFPLIKLRRGVTPATAGEEFQAYVKHFKQQTPLHFPDDFHVNVEPIAAPYMHRTGQAVKLLFASVVFLLLIGCANCSVLLLARGEARQHELSIRAAIGASRLRLMRQLLIESLAIAFIGAALGTALSFWLANLPLKLMPGIFPQEAAIGMNWRILAFSIALALITGILFGLAPALRFSRPDVSQMIQSRSRTLSSSGGHSLNMLIGAQVALTLLLLGVAGAAVTGFMRLTSMKLGYDPHNVGFVSVPLKWDPNKNQPAYTSYIEQLRNAVAAVPGVQSASILSSFIPPSQPFGGMGKPYIIELLGQQTRPEQYPSLVHLISPEFFATVKTPLTRGRLWTADENRRGDFVAIVNESFVQRYLGGREPIGQQIRTDGLRNDGRSKTITSPNSGEWRQIVGVVADARNDGLERPVFPAVYVPYSTFMWYTTRIFFRAETDPRTLERPLRAALHNVNASQRIFGNEIGTLDEALTGQTVWVQQHMFSVLFTFFGVLALSLSLFGIASTVLFAVGRRRNELGIRMALGAQRSHIIWTVASTMFATIACGIVAGFAIHLAAQHLLAHWMPAGNHSPWVFAPAAGLLLLGAAAACLLPAMRAAYANPLETLRAE